MKSVHKTVIVAHPQERMFSLVDRIEDYPKFLPWCGGTQVHSRTAETVEAEIQIAYRGVRQSFVTRNQNAQPERIDMNFVRGPFRALAGHWQFIRLGDLGCKIDFLLEYEFASSILEKLVGPIFDSIANTFVDAFVRHADESQR